MAKHIHIHLHRTTDADGPAHAPAGSSKGGQFVSGSGGGGGKSTPKHTPMKQAHRDLEAKQLKESKQIAKMGQSPGVNPGVRQMQAKSDVEEAKKRIAARKQPAHLAPGSQLFTSHKASAHKATSVGPDPDSAHHHIVKVGNSTVSVPKTQLHATANEAHVATGNPEKVSASKAPPTTLSHKGASYTSTGKSGKHLSTGEDIHEYEQVDKAGQRTGSRVWRSASGKIHQD